MAFGFDPSIILQQTRTAEPTPNETLRTLADLANSRMHRQVQGATLADLMRRQQQEQELSDVYRRNAGAFEDPLASQAALAGLLQAPEIQTNAMRWQQSAANLAEAKRRRDALANPNSPTSRLRIALARQFGAQLDEGTAGNDIDDNELNLLERAQTSRDLAKLRYGPGAVGGYNQEAIDAMALQVLRSGHVPQFGPGATGAALRQTVFNRVAELAGGATPGQGAGGAPRAVPDLATTAADYEANVNSLKEGRKVADATDVNEGKALADIQVLESTMDKVFNSRSPWLNAVGRKLQENAGNPDVAAFLTARQALVAQVNKVLNSGNLTEAARKEADELLRHDASIAQIKSVLGILKQDMARSRDATHARVTAAKARISGKPEASAHEAAAPKTVVSYRYNTGRTKRKPVYSDGTEGPAEAVNGQ